MDNFSEIIYQGLEAMLTPHSLPFFSLLRSNSFKDDLVFHVYWNHRDCYAELLSFPRAENWMQSNYYDSRNTSDTLNLDLVFHKQSGTFPKSAISSILSKLKRLQLPLILEEPPIMGRDGSNYTLSLGQSSVQQTISWWNIITPTGWEALDSLAETIETFATTLTLKKREIYHFSYSCEGGDLKTTTFTSIGRSDKD